LQQGFNSPGAKLHNFINAYFLLQHGEVDLKIVKEQRFALFSIFKVLTFSSLKEIILFISHIWKILAKCCSRRDAFFIGASRTSDFL